MKAQPYISHICRLKKRFLFKLRLSLLQFFRSKCHVLVHPTTLWHCFIKWRNLNLRCPFCKSMVSCTKVSIALSVCVKWMILIKKREQGTFSFGAVLATKKCPLETTPSCLKEILGLGLSSCWHTCSSCCKDYPLPKKCMRYDKITWF